MPIIKKVYRQICVFILAFFLHQTAYPQQNKKDASADMFFFIERNFKFLDTSQNSLKSNFAFLKMFKDKAGIQVEYSSFNNSFCISLAALADSLKRKLTWKTEYPELICVPLEFIVDGDLHNPNHTIVQEFDALFRKKAPISKPTILITKPVVLIKNERKA